MKQRIVTGAVAGGVYLGLLLIGSYPFALLAAAIAVVAYFETAHIKNLHRFSLPVVTGGLAVVIIVAAASFPLEETFSFIIVRLAIVLALLLISMTVFSRNRFSFESAAYLFFSALYIAVPFYLLVRTRNESLALILFIQITMWATDSGAYFIGRQFGRHKLAAHISPNKTIEGSLGAIVSAFVTAAIIQWFCGKSLFSSWLPFVASVAVISILGQLGDLAESAVKRFYGVKDSGTILPGHGGLFDRFDSLIFILPVLYLLGLLG